MKPLYQTFAAVSLLFSTQVAHAATANVKQCEALKDAQLYNTVIKSAKWQPAGTIKDPNNAFTGTAAQEVNAQAHCLVEGEIEPRTGANGEHFGTNFQLRLPENWNGKFLFQGGGGANGFIAPAVGTTPIHASTAPTGLVRGYAVVSMDSGHQGGVMNTRSLIEDQQAKLDYAYAAIGKVTERAKLLIHALYQQKPSHSYFMGCSTGGREAMIAAQRYPNEFDGAVSVNAAFHLSSAAMGATTNYQLLTAQAAKTSGQIKDIFSQKDLDTVSNAILKQCDAKDGLTDGLVTNWESCDFNPDSVKDTLGEEKVALLKAFFGEKKTKDGKVYHTGYPFDPSINQPSWTSWWLDNQAANYLLTVPLLSHYFMQPNHQNFDPLTFDANRDMALVENVGALNDATSPNLTTFKANGGKMIIIDGGADPIFSPYDRRQWFKQANEASNGLNDTAKWFVVPGMTHCGGGNTLDDLDPLTALENWREKGKTPDFLLAKGKAFPNKEMPICAYPKVATYIGGDKNKASSFECQ